MAGAVSWMVVVASTGRFLATLAALRRREELLAATPALGAVLLAMLLTVLVATLGA